MKATRFTDKPFQVALKEFLAENEISQRELIRRTRKRGWGSTGAISLLLADEAPPSVRAMEAIATGLGIRPEFFAEYRLAKARSCLDPQVVGLEAALNGLGAAKLALAGK
jgi:transcriptional regulator with XRE-family HTH domain